MHHLRSQNLTRSEPARQPWRRAMSTAHQCQWPLTVAGWHSLPTCKRVKVSRPGHADSETAHQKGRSIRASCSRR